MSAALGQVGAGSGFPDGELVIKGNGVAIGGWQSVSITRGVLRMPSDFAVSTTAKFPGEVRSIIPLNSPLQITIGNHVVITGYLERNVNDITPGQHEVRLSGRGRCCDLVDCAAIIEGQLGLNISSVGNLARQLVKPFAGPITVLTPDGDGAGKSFSFQINLSESPYEVLERMCRFEGLLPYENADGNLVLARVGTKQHSSGFTEGQNVQAIRRFDTRDERYSSYIPQIMSSDTMGKLGSGGNDAGKPVADPGITRYRPKIIISEQMDAGSFFAQVRANWEAQQRIGQSLRVELTCDSWLDSSGMPWTPNMMARVSMPSIALDQVLIITQVTYRRDKESGTTALVTLMPKEALTIEPIAQQNQLATRNPLGLPSPDTTPITAPNGTTRPTGPS